MDVIRLGAFELYPSDRRLCINGKPVDLGARAFDLLLVLVEHRGHLVTKATLLERVWPRLVVDENNLPAQIASLRRVLGAGAIRTVSGFGYRLELGDSLPSQGSTQKNPEPLKTQPALPALTVARRAWSERLGSLVGREDDVRAVREALNRSSLVTIVGIAGVGKTRLAQEVLARESERTDIAIAWVALASIQEIRHVAAAIALALGLSLPEGIDGFAALAPLLERSALLLVLDNAEQLGDALAAPLAALISQTQAVRLLLTSQAPLGVVGETIYRLPVLPVPQPGTPDTQVAEYAAVTLFAERVRAADRGFKLSSANTELIGEICRRLDGIPLALELAAARVPALGLEAVRDRLDDRFRLLRLASQPQDSRHGALRTAFEWSYGLLGAREQRVFDRLGAFAGSFPLREAARCVIDNEIDLADAIDLIGRLVDRSLLMTLSVDPPRYVLPETARFLALERLKSREQLDAARERMAATMLELLDQAYQEYWSLDEAIWLHRYEADLSNVRAALAWASEHDPALAVGLYGSAWPLFVETDLQAEGRGRYGPFLALLTDSMPNARLARFWEAAATYYSARQWDRARYAAELAANGQHVVSDARAEYYAFTLLASNARADASAESAINALRRLEDAAWPPRLLACGALAEGDWLACAGKISEARAAYQRATRFALTISERLALVATVSVVELDVACGDVAAALQLGLPLSQSLQYIGRRETRIDVLGLCLSALLLEGRLDQARTIAAELYELCTRFDSSKLYSALDAMALLACQQQQYSTAARIECFADVAYRQHGELRRGPAQERMRLAVTSTLDRELGAWREHPQQDRDPLDEAAACSLALGRRV
jgi:predicted ATPase/DNA-binding winged helix-turn-helix (wHTH) protein